MKLPMKNKICYIEKISLALISDEICQFNTDRSGSLCNRNHQMSFTPAIVIATDTWDTGSFMHGLALAACFTLSLQLLTRQTQSSFSRYLNAAALLWAVEIIFYATSLYLQANGPVSTGLGETNILHEFITGLTSNFFDFCSRICRTLFLASHINLLPNVNPTLAFRSRVITGIQILVILFAELLITASYIVSSQSLWYSGVYIVMDLVIQMIGTGQLLMIFDYLDKQHDKGKEAVNERKNARYLVLFWGIATILLHSTSVILGFTRVDPFLIYQVKKFHQF